MLRSIGQIWHRLRGDENGNVFVLFGATAIPLLLIMGGAVDFARYNRYKADLANAVDSGALALARRVDDYNATCPSPDEGDPAVYCEEASEDLVEFIAAFDVSDDRFNVGEIRADRVNGGFLVTADGEMETMFLPLGNLTNTGTQITTMDMSIVAEVRTSSNRLELALVLDNTGSMNCVGATNVTCAMDWQTPDAGSRIVALRSAANELVNTLMVDDMENPDLIKIAVVPFEGMVNVASPGFDVTNPPTWIDWGSEGTATWNGRNFTTYNVDADAALERVGHRFLFNKLTADDSRVKWGGCVEMRAGTYELSDAIPSVGIADSLYVPFFAPDEPDSGGTYYNNYLEDRVSGSVTARQTSMTKYSDNSNIRWHSGRMDYDATSTPYEYGPNRGCPDPIVPLTNADGKATITTAIDNMQGFWASGTYIPAGLLWGWNVLTPDIPYTEGLAPGDEYYEETIKAIVLLTDGDNEVPNLGNHNGSGYSGYSYVTTSISGPTYRLGSTVTAAATALDTKTASLCTSVKAAGIRVYTITFGPLASDVQTMMSNCATLDGGDRLHYHAPTSADLDDIFREIGEDLTEIHLSM
jgi:hypothetical protein